MLFVVWCLLFVVLVCVVCCLLFVVCCLLFVACRLLFVACGLLLLVVVGVCLLSFDKVRCWVFMFGVGRCCSLVFVVVC